MCVCLFTATYRTVHLQDGTPDGDLIEEDWPPYIAIVGPPLTPTDHKLIAEKTILVDNIDQFQDAIALFIGLIYVLNLQYNSKNTFDFIQCALLHLEKVTSKKALSLFGKLRG